MVELLSLKQIPEAFNFLTSKEFHLLRAADSTNEKSALLIELARKYNCVPTESAVKEILKENIKNHISGSSINRNAFKKFEKYIAVSYFAGDSTFRTAFLILGYLRVLINDVDSYSLEPGKWLSALGELELLLPLANIAEDSITSLYASYKILGESVRFFREKDIVIEVEIDRIKITESENDRLIKLFQRRLLEIGFWGARLTLEEIEKFYQSTSNRYLLNHTPSLTSPPQLQIPWGYIFKASLAHYRPTPKTKVTENKFWTTVEGLRQYLCLYGLQKYHAMEFYDTDTIMPALRQKIMYDNVFSIPQTNPHHLLRLIDGLMQGFLREHPRLQMYLDIFAFILKKCNGARSISLEPREFTNELILKYPDESIRSVLNDLAFFPKQVNQGYDYPEKIDQLNYFMRPLIFNGAHYMCVNTHFVGVGFFFVMYQSLRSQGLKAKFIDTAIGKGAERFLGELFKNSGISVISEKKYKISKDKQKSLGTLRQEGECDFIIETSSHIIFLELKSKNLNVTSRGGDIVQATEDLSKSLFYGLAQTGWHELMLRLDDHITFIDGTSLFLNGRTVERATISLLDFYSVDDSNFVHQLLNSLLGSKITSNTHSVPEDIHEYMDELYHQYNHELFAHYRKQQNPFWNCSFFSIPQLMVVLENSIDNESFYKELFSARSFTVGGSNWYQDYYARRSLLN